MNNALLFGESPESWKVLRADVEDFLRQYQGRRILYWPNPGNGGDSLIAAATYEAFERIGIEIGLAGFKTNVEGEVVILAGGGNLVPYYDDMSKAWSHCLDGAARIVMLPQTIRGHEQLLARMDERCTLFARDRESFDHVKTANPAVDVRLAHDMAFHLNAQSFLAREDLTLKGEPILIDRLGQRGLTMADVSAWPSVDMLRLDGESAQADPASDLDISDLFMMGVNPDEAPVATWCFLRAISLANHVNTDRLHVGIGAALLGVPCTLRDNTYGKNVAVYSHSMKGLSRVRLVKAGPRETVAGRNLRLEVEALRVALESSKEELQAREVVLDELNRSLLDTRGRCEELDVSVCALNSSLLEATRVRERQEGELAQLSQANATLHVLLASQDAVKREAAELRRRGDELAARLGQVQNTARAFEQNHLIELERSRQASERASSTASRLNAVLNSRSWRYTAPLRRLRGIWPPRTNVTR